MFVSEISNLNRRSDNIITVMCDVCENISDIRYILYTRNGHIGGDYLCRKCKSIKTNLERYGVENVSQSDSIKDRKKVTNLEKFGVEYASQNLDIKNKVKATNLERYGVDNVFQSDVVIKTSKDTIIRKYGVDNISKLDVIKNKKKETTKKNYGVESPLQSEEIREKLRATNLDRYGVKYIGEISISINEDFRKLNFIIAKDINYIKYISNGTSIFNCDNGFDHQFEITADNYCHRNKNKITLCTVCYPIGDNKSIKEKCLLEYIQSVYSGKILSGYRYGLEIDIYIPELKIGFEFNGLYFHSEKFRDKNYHLDKTNFFKDKGIRIIHIWEDDWDYKRDIIKSQISNILKLNTEKIFARKCEIKEIYDIKIIRQFLDDNHIQGFVSSVRRLGLYHKDELVSVMTFDNFEGRKKMETGGWNLSRFCNKLGLNIIGGASKLLSFFVKEYNPSRIVSYADKGWSVGSLYYTLGFKNINELGTDYKYVINGIRSNKSKFRRSNLKTSTSESNTMKDLEINKIYDCGKIKFEMIIST